MMREERLSTQQTRQCGAHMGFTWATGVQSGHGLKMGILSGPHLGDPARTHMGEPRWASYLGPTWVTQLGPTWVNPGGHLIWGPLG